MPFFKVRLSGAGIEYPFVYGGDPVIGFFATRAVRARDIEHAHQLAKEAVLSEWRPGGRYAAENRGHVPSLVVEDSWRVGVFDGLFGRRPGGYTFYTHDD